MSYRILNQAPQYLLPNGQPNAGGSLVFYETDLTNAKNTWSDEGLTVLNPNPVLMDAAGRTQTDVWGDGEYGVVMLDGLANVIWTRNPVNNGVTAGATIPALVAGQFLSNDGSILTWEPVLQVPDPTGLNGYVLASDGTGVPIWKQEEAGDDPDVDDEAVLIGNKLLQFGAGICPTPSISPYHGSSVTVTFPTPFGGTPRVFAMPLGTTTSFNTYIGTMACNPTATTAEIQFTTNEADADSTTYVTGPVPFQWFAIGPAP